MIKRLSIWVILCMVSFLPWVPSNWSPNLPLGEWVWGIAALFSLGIILIIIKWSNRQGLSRAPIWDKDWKRYTATGFVIGVIAYVLAFIWLWFMGSFTILATRSLREMWPAALMTLLYMLYVAITEELIFRGYVMTAMNQTFTLRRSIIISIGLFVVYHLPKLHLLLHTPYAIQLTVMGLVFCLAYLKSGSIWTSIGLHWGWNTAVCFLMINEGYLGQLGFQSRIIHLGDHHGMFSWLDLEAWITTIVIVFLVVVLYLNKNEAGRNVKGPQPQGVQD